MVTSAVSYDSFNDVASPALSSPSCFRSFIEDSEANIKISPQDNSYIGLNDRLVTVAGTLQQQMVATNLIISKLSKDLNYIQSIGPPFTYRTRHSVPNYGPNGGGKKFHIQLVL
nr:KH domain-containing protein [Tanacetum cinerariifolium]